MVDNAALCVKDQISRLELGCIDGCPHFGLCSRRMGQGYAVLGKYAEHKAGTVCAFGKAGAAPHIRISQKLLCILAQIHPYIRNALSVHKLCHGNCRFQVRFHIHIVGGYKHFFIIQINFDPAVVLYFHNIQTFAGSHLGNHLCIKTGHLTDVQGIRCGYRNGCGKFFPFHLGVKACEKIFFLHISFHFAGSYIGPAVFAAFNFTGRILGKFSHQLPVFTWLLSDI